MENKKIVITGMGAVTPLGTGVADYWSNLIAGKSGIANITKIDASDLPVRIAGEVKGFDPVARIPSKIVENMDDFMHYAYAAAEEALTESGLEINPHRTGIVMGTALDGLSTICRTQQEVSEEGARVSPKFVTKVLGNIAAAQIAIAHGLKGPSMTVNTACSSGGDAIILAAMLLKAGEADVMVAAGGESGIGSLFIQSLAKAMALSMNNEFPEKACRPFDLHRDGFVIGEGGGALILETEEHALRRGADIKAELIGYANNSDGFHVVAPDPEGRGAAACMRRALEVSGIAPEEVGYINAHGTATLKGDFVEAMAINAVFGEHAGRLPVSSTKGATGHLMGAGGVTEAIACIRALQTGLLPPGINCDTPDPQCELDLVLNTARQRDIRIAMSNAYGFGGQNCSIVLKKYGA